MSDETEKRDRPEENDIKEERPSKLAKTAIENDENGGTTDDPTGSSEATENGTTVVPVVIPDAAVDTTVTDSPALMSNPSEPVVAPVKDDKFAEYDTTAIDSPENTSTPTEPIAEPIKEETPAYYSATDKADTDSPEITSKPIEPVSEPIKEDTPAEYVAMVSYSPERISKPTEPVAEPIKNDKPAQSSAAKKGVSSKPSSLPSGLPPLETNAQSIVTNPEAMVEERGQVSSHYVGRVIGKGGEMIRDLQARSGCRIDVDQNVPSGQPRIITYRGTRRTVDDAKKMVSLLCQHDGNETLLPIGEAKRKHMVVPSSAIGKIIGRGGEMIRELQNRSQAKIQVDHSASSQLGSGRAMTITGTGQAVAKAEEMVLFLVANPLMDAMVSIDMLVHDKVKNGGRWGSGPPYLNLPNHGQNMIPQGEQQPPINPYGGYGPGPSMGGGSSYPGYPTQHGGGGHFGIPPSQQSHYGTGPGSSEVEVFLATKMYMGRIIGQKGMTINDIQKRSGCDIQVNQNVPPGQDCEITIKGSRQGIESVKHMLREIIEMGPNHPYAGGQGQYNVSGGGSGSYPPVHHGGFGGAPPPQTHGAYQQQPPMQQSMYGQPLYGGQQAPYLTQQPYIQPMSMGGMPPYQSPHMHQYTPPPQYGQPQQPYQNPPQQQYAPPPMVMPVAPVWKSAKTGDGQVYYYNEKTGETQWDKPAGMP